MMRLATRVHARIDEGGATWLWLARSAAMMRIDAVAAELLAAFDRADGLDPEEHLQGLNGARAAHEEALGDLIAIGAIRPLGEISPPGSDLPPMPFPLATLVLNVTNKCNLSCTYCYEYGEDRLASPTAEGQVRRPRSSMMSAETARESIDFLFRSAKGRPAVTITFFGGETLLNLDTIRAAVAHAESRAAEEGIRVHFALTTNATLLEDDVIDFLVDHAFGINVSIDGDEETHDRHRRFRSGKGSHALILPRIRRLLERNAGRGRPIGARVTVTRGTADLRGLYRHLVEEIGFDEVGFAPVTSAPGRDYALGAPDYDHLLEEYGALAADYVEAAIAGRRHGFSNLGDLLRELHQGTNKAHPCGAGLGLLGVSTDGDLGLCHRFVESGDHEVGHVRAGVDEEKRSGFLRAAHVEKKIDCASCFARPVCAGGCYHEAQVRYGDATRANLHYCDWIRAWTTIGLRAYANISVANPTFFDAFERSST